jgi:anaerobic selenocysteine-containing dehydrogenase
MEQRVTYCRICTAACGVIVELDETRIVRILGDNQHPLSGGYTCEKGRSFARVHHHPDRLTRPMVRTGASDRSSASWDEALNRLSAAVKAIIDAHGPDAVSVFKGTHHAFDALGRRVSNTLFRDLGTSRVFSPVTVDATNKTFVPDLVTGAPYLFPLIDWDSSKLVIFVGENPLVSHGHPIPISNPSARIRNLRRGGARVIVIDPKRTETAGVADLHVQPDPGSDPAVLGFLIREILASGGDQQYLRDYVDPASLDRLASMVAPLTEVRASSLSGVPAETLKTMAAWIREAGRISLISGTGISMGPAPNVGELFGWALAAVTGSLDRVGGTIFNPGTLRPQEGGVLKRVANLDARPVSRPELPNFYGELPSVALADEILSGGVRALFVIGGNPLLCLPDRVRVEKALESLELLVVMDIVENDLTRMSHFALPCADQFERNDITSVIDLGMPVPFVQATGPVVKASGEQLELWRIAWRIGRHLGLSRFQGPEPSADEVLADEAKRSRVPWSTIRSARAGVLADAPGPGWLVPNQVRDGRLNLAPEELVPEFNRWLTQAAAPADHYRLITGRRKDRVNSFIVAAGPKAGTLLMSPTDAASEGFRDGEAVEVFNDNGTIAAVVTVSDTLRTGVVQLTHGSVEPAVNRLTSAVDRVEPLTGMPQFTALPVQVRRGLTARTVSDIVATMANSVSVDTKSAR